ncbi:MAG: DUF934 domain-containing protein [Gammaproteobacteria bacterium]|nr:DUF934 domain-containing protein [Gammaproteobacteria bacterium]
MPQHIDTQGRLHSPYTLLDDEQGVPDGKQVLLISCARFLAEPAPWLARGGGFGVLVKNTESPLALETYLPNLPLIALEFPAFTDGRAYSQARLLRRLGYAGQLHARGTLAIDQVRELFSCGFDSLEIPDHWPGELVLTLRGQISVSYQDWCRDLAVTA